MSTLPRSTPHLTAVVLCLSAGVLAGCGSTPPPSPSPGTEGGSSPGPAGGSSPAGQAQSGTGEETASVYVGAYDQSFHDERASYSGQQVSLTGEIQDLIRSRSSFQLASPTDPGLDPLLVNAAYAAPDLEVGDTVEVTGTLRKSFQPPVVEEAVEGGEEAGFYDQHLGEPYLDGAQVKAVESPAG